MNLRMCFLGILATSASACGSASQPPPACPSTAPLQARIDRLEAKVAELEETNGAAVAPPPAERSAPAEPAARTWDESVANVQKHFDDDGPGGSKSAAFEKSYGRVFLLPAAKGAPSKRSSAARYCAKPS